MTLPGPEVRASTIIWPSDRDSSSCGSIYSIVNYTQHGCHVERHDHFGVPSHRQE